jgi:regulatory protein
MKLCSRQERCKADLRQKLFQWKISDEIASKIIRQLEADNFISEERFATAFAKDKIRFNKWGKNKVRYHLKMKDISEANISRALSNIDDSEYNAMIQKEVLVKNLKTKADSDWQRKGKIMHFAQSRGYETEIVMNILDKIID